MMILFPELKGYWYGVSDRDDRAVALYERHYSCINKGRRATREITPPGHSMVLLGANCDALWVWSVELKRRDGQQGVNCNVFRNESSVKSSVLIREAMEIAWQRWPGQRLFTFINTPKIRSTNPGYCFQVCGWRKCGYTKVRGLIILEYVPTATKAAA